MTMTTMRTLASITAILVASTADAFTPPIARSIVSTTPSTTALNHIDTRHHIPDQEKGIWPQSCHDYQGNYVPCDAICGHDVRSKWETYAPSHGSPTAYGAIGCPGGGDWCYASSYAAAAPISENVDAKKKAATVLAALAGLGSGVDGARDVGLAFPNGGAGGGGAALFALPSSSGGSVMGEDVREARGTYSPFDHEGRVGTLGEIGAGVTGGEPHSVGLAMPSGKQVGGTGGFKNKQYGLGSWKK